MIEIQYLWEHWKFDADQRIKAFNFFVVFSIFADSGVFTALEKGAHPLVLTAIGFLVIALASAFWAIDVRSERLIRLSEPGLKAYEKSLTDVSRIFHEDEANRSSWIRYRNSFRALFLIQLVFGAVVLAVGLLTAAGALPHNMLAPSVVQTIVPPSTTSAASATLNAAPPISVSSSAKSPPIRRQQQRLLSAKSSRSAQEHRLAPSTCVTGP